MKNAKSRIRRRKKHVQTNWYNYIERITVWVVFILSVSASATVHIGTQSLIADTHVEATERVKTDSEPSESPFIIEITSIATKSAEPHPTGLSKKTQGCMKARPDVADKIIAKFPEEKEHALELICRESSFNPEILNPSSGACGLAQALPCSKMKCELSDAGVDCQLEWIGEYVENRYGSFKETIVFHDRMNWY